MTQTLMRITADLKAVLDLIDQEQGELTPVLENWLTDISNNLTHKVDAYKGRLDQIKLLAEECRKRAQDAQRAAQRLEHVQTALEDRIKEAMLNLGTMELKGSEWRYKLTPSVGRLELNEALVPKEFKVTTIVESADKAKIRAAIESGEVVPGAEIKPGFQLRKSLNTGG
jgi:hypothetical protein